MVIDSTKGVETQTYKLLEVCRMRETPIITFMNKSMIPTYTNVSMLPWAIYIITRSLLRKRNK